MNPIYLDYAATTPVDPQVANVMSQCLTMDGYFGNPASHTHFYGWQAYELVEKARENVATLINADTREIVFTSGATEANNLAIKGVAEGYKHKGKHIVTSAIEHQAVLDPCQYLEKSGFEVTYVTPDANGIVSLDRVASAIREDTILVSIMYVNNELGTIQPIADIGDLCRSRKILLHVDAAQAVGKIAVDVRYDKIDLLSISAHKLYGPKGSGALYVRRRPKVKLIPQIHGGGHEGNRRSGTLATHQIAGLGEACKIALTKMGDDRNHIESLRTRLVETLQNMVNIRINTCLEQSFPGIINITVEGVDGEALMMALNDLAISAGSACNSATIEASHVLSAIGLSNEQANGALRISLGRFTSFKEIESACQSLKTHVQCLQNLSPIGNGL